MMLDFHVLIQNDVMSCSTDFHSRQKSCDKQPLHPRKISKLNQYCRNLIFLSRTHENFKEHLVTRMRVPGDFLLSFLIISLAGKTRSNFNGSN